ncbi:MAG: DUF4864 domain-containing protein [Alphaproteobacteria bacterium]|nr:DUF4864 domain-containing protein [Alphaproteobacteria bacterium]
MYAEFMYRRPKERYVTMQDHFTGHRSKSGSASVFAALCLAAVLAAPHALAQTGQEAVPEQQAVPEASPGVSPEVSPDVSQDVSPETPKSGTTAQIEAATPEIEAAIQETIIGQIEAFQSDDGDLALTFAIPQARRIWPTAEVFMTMVRQGYGPIYRPAAFSFEGAVTIGTVARQFVRVTGENGDTVLALYDMYLQADGVWLIGGVRTVPVESEDDQI